MISIFACRRSVYCSVVSDGGDQPSPTALLSRRALLGATAVIAAIAPLPAQADSVIDGQGNTQVLPLTAEEDLTIPQRQVLEYNRRTQRQNGAPPDFPLFIKEGYDMTVLVSDGYQVRFDPLWFLVLIF